MALHGTDALNSSARRRMDRTILWVGLNRLRILVQSAIWCERRGGVGIACDLSAGVVWAMEYIERDLRLGYRFWLTEVGISASIEDTRECVLNACVGDFPTQRRFPSGAAHASENPVRRRAISPRKGDSRPAQPTQRRSPSGPALAELDDVSGSLAEAFHWAMNYGSRKIEMAKSYGNR